MKLRKGFTLIELLVVIAIIGILAAMILVALNAARQKARDARVKSDLHQLAVDATTYYDNKGGTFVGWELQTAVTGPNFYNIKADVKKNSNGGVDATFATSTASEWAVSAPISTGTVCTDSTGATKDGVVSGTACTGANL